MITCVWSIYLIDVAYLCFIGIQVKMRKLRLSLKVSNIFLDTVVMLAFCIIGALVRSGEDYLTTEKPKLLQPIDQPNKKVIYHVL